MNHSWPCQFKYVKQDTTFSKSPPMFSDLLSSPLVITALPVPLLAWVAILCRSLIISKEVSDNSFSAEIVSQLSLQVSGKAKRK